MQEEKHRAARPWWRKKRTWFIGLVSMLAAASLWLRSYNEAEPGGLVRTQIGGYKSAEGMGLFPISLLIAVRKFPRYEDCVEPKPGGGLQPKWGAITNEAQVKVCIFRIADRHGSPEATQAYFQELGLRSTSFKESASRGGVHVSCSLTKEPCTLPTLNVFLIGMARYGVAISYQDSKPIGIEVDYEIL